MLTLSERLRSDQPMYYVGNKVRVKSMEWFESNCKQDPEGDFYVQLHGDYVVLMARSIVQRYAGTVQVIRSFKKYVIPNYKDILVYKFENGEFDWWYTDVFSLESAD